MSRNRETAQLWLSLDELENDTDRTRLGEPATPAEGQHRAVNAYTRKLAQGGHDHLVVAELEHVDLQPPHRTRDRQAQEDVNPGRVRREAHSTASRHDRERQQREDAAARHSRAGVDGREWRRHRHGELTDAQLRKAIADAQRRHDFDALVETAAAQQRQLARAGRGPHAVALQQRREHLTQAAAFETQAQQAHAAHQQTRMRIEQLRRQAQRNPIALRLAGTSRPEIRQQIQQLQDIAEQQLQAMKTAQSQARPHRQAAQVGAEPAATVLGRLNNTWDAALNTAINRDLHHADAEIRGHPARLLAITQPIRDLDELHAEQQRRGTLTADQTHAEAIDRDNVRAAQAILAQRPPSAEQSGASTPSRNSHTSGRGYER